MNIPAVIKRKNKWLVGFITSDIKFRKKAEIKKLSEIKKHTNYITLQKHLRTISERSQQKNLAEKILTKLNAESCYVLNNPMYLSDSEWELWWWNDYNKICKPCKYTCKQSHKVKIHNCRFLMEK